MPGLELGAGRVGPPVQPAAWWVALGESFLRKIN